MRARLQTKKRFTWFNLVVSWSTPLALRIVREKFESGENYGIAEMLYDTFYRPITKKEAEACKYMLAVPPYDKDGEYLWNTRD